MFYLLAAFSNPFLNRAVAANFKNVKIFSTLVFFAFQRRVVFKHLTESGFCFSTQSGF